MRLLTADSETSSMPKSLSPDDATGETIESLKRARPLRVMLPHLERLCQPQSESFWVLGGRPGAFKTAMLWNLALNAAERGHRVMFVTLEMTPAEMALLALAKFSGLPRNRIKAHFQPLEPAPFDTLQRQAWDRAMLRFQGLEMHLRIHGADQNGRDLNDVIRSACRARFDAVMVDHLGMIGRDSGGRELDVLSQAIHRLRGLSRGEAAKGYRPWVVATSQLNREIDKGDEDRIPRLSDFRGSSRIEHDADVAVGLQKRRGQEDDAGVSILDGFVLKNRNGPCPAVLSWSANGETGLISQREQQRNGGDEA